jgi:low affinity Fe/Cu permease
MPSRPRRRTLLPIVNVAVIVANFAVWTPQSAASERVSAWATEPRRNGMDFSAQLDELQRRVAETKSTVQAAATESREQLRQRIDQIQTNMDQTAKEAKQQTGQAADRAQSKWAQMKADATAKREDVKAKIDKRTRQLDAKAAASDADWAEADAADALDYAAWTVDNARLATLDAIDARAYADERAKAASS